MRTLSLSSLKLLLALSVAPALVVANTGCSGSDEKPAGDDDDDDDDATDADTDADADADTDTDTDTDSDSDTDSGYYYDTGVLRFTITGEAQVDAGAGTYEGTETQGYLGFANYYACDIEYQATGSTTVTQSTADLSSCAFGSVPCEFAFEVTFDNPSLSAQTPDCAAFGITDKAIAGSEYSIPYGFVQDYLFTGTYTTGGQTKSFSLTDSMMLYWIDYKSYVGWYPAPDSLYGMYYGLPDTTLNGNSLEYTLYFNYYIYYL